MKVCISHIPRILLPQDSFPHEIALLHLVPILACFYHREERREGKRGRKGYEDVLWESLPSDHEA
jgi:hypothetical protein